MDKILQYQRIPSSSWALWSAGLREKYGQGKKEKAQPMRDYAGQGYKFKRRPEFITANQLQRNDAGVQKVVLKKQEGNDGPVSLHWLICKFPSYQTLKYLGIGLKHKTPKKD